MKFENKKIFIKNKSYFSFLIFTLLILFIEYLNFFNYFLNNSIPSWINDVIAVLIFATILLFLFFKKIIVFEHRSKREFIELLIGSIIIFAIFFFMTFFPDQGFDTFNYHLAAQNPYFENYFVEDYGYGNFQIWGFRLPNRLFYIFRYILGYRLGTLPSILTLIISFISMYDLLGVLFNQNNTDSLMINQILLNKAVWSLVIVLQFHAIIMIGSYGVELLVIPFVIEALTILLNRKEKQTTVEICYFALLCGLIIAFKMTNVVYVVPFVIYYFVYYVRKSKIYDWLLAIVFGLLPMAIYLIFNYICTKNPIFPYFNTIFKSSYYSVEDFKDLRWGGSNTFEKVFWIFFAIFKPDYRQNEVPEKFAFGFIIGLISILIFIVSLLINRKNLRKDKEIIFSYLSLLLFSISSLIFWSFSTGYSRYYVFGKMMWTLMGYISLLYLSKIKWVPFDILKGISLGGAIFASALYIAMFYSGNSYSFYKFSWGLFTQEVSKSFKDNDIHKDYDIDADMFFITNQERMCVAELVNPNAYVFNAAYTYASSGYQETLKEKINEYENIYDVYYKHLTEIQNYASLLDSYSFVITDLKKITTGAGDYNFVKLDYQENAKNDIIVYQDDIEIDTNNRTGEAVLSFIGARYFSWESEEKNELNVDIYIENNNVTTYVTSYNVNTVYPKKYEINLNLSEGDKIVMRAKEAYGEELNESTINKLFLLNPKII